MRYLTKREQRERRDRLLRAAKWWTGTIIMAGIGLLALASYLLARSL